MRAIIVLLAIFACASARLNGQQVYQGFSTKLGFTLEHHKELQACGMEIATTARKYLAPGKTVLQAQLLGLLFADDAKHREALLAVAQFAQTALPACRQFAQSFVTLLGSKVNITADEHYAVNLFKYRLQKNSAEIISELARLPEAHFNGNDAKIGETIAHIIQIIIGADHPETVIEYAQKYSAPFEVSVIETDRYLVQVINSAAQELGVSGQITEQRVKELRVAAQGVFAIYFNTMIQIHNTRSLVDREVVVLAALRDLTKALLVVKENVITTLSAFSVNVSAYEVQTFKRQVLGNYLINLPTIQRRVVDAVLGARAHKPVATGKAIAGIVKAFIYRH